MRFAIFCHSIVSDWNHGNAHFLRGVVRALRRLGHDVDCYEPKDGWSRTNLLETEGVLALALLEAACRDLDTELYDEAELDPDLVFATHDVVVVHEWTPPTVLRRLAESRRRHPKRLLLFHDTHHRMVTEPEAMPPAALAACDGVLAFGRVIADLYRQRGLADQVFVWHEAADTTIFAPQPDVRPRADVVWVGNWGDDERADELREFLIEPVAALGLSAAVYGVRWPAAARRELDAAGIAYHGWLPNHVVPAVFAAHRVTVHVPRRPYATALPGIPTIRPFEALACGIPLVSAPWDDAEGLFDRGRDHLLVRDGGAMRRALERLMQRPGLRSALAERGLRTIRSRHTCMHRAHELTRIVGHLKGRSPTIADPRRIAR